MSSTKRTLTELSPRSNRPWNRSDARSGSYVGFGVGTCGGRRHARSAPPKKRKPKRILYAQDTHHRSSGERCHPVATGRNEPVTGAAGERKKPRLSGAFARWAVLGSNQ